MKDIARRVLEGKHMANMRAWKEAARGENHKVFSQAIALYLTQDLHHPKPASPDYDLEII